MKTKSLSIATILGSLYVVIGLVTPTISFGAIQCRVADALYPLIALFGYPAVYGLTLGSFIYNLYGYGIGVALGPLDLLSPLVFLIPKLLIARYGLKAVPTHIIAITLWVPYLLNQMFSIPIEMTAPTVFAGEFIAEIILGLPLYHAVKKAIT